MSILPSTAILLNLEHGSNLINIGQFIAESLHTGFPWHEKKEWSILLNILHQSVFGWARTLMGLLHTPCFSDVCIDGYCWG